MIACHCDGLPPHDHHIGNGMVPMEYRNGAGQVIATGEAYGPVYDYDDVGRVWVDWRAVARSLIAERVAS